MKATLNDLFDSSARVIHLSHFRHGRLMWDGSANTGQYEYSFSQSEGESYFPKMPVILQSNGLPWDIGNAYLLGQLDTPTLSSMKTLTARATHLKYYLQYLEDTGQHFLDLPKLYYERAPQKFSVFMSRILDNNDFSAEHINNILSTVAHFYTNISYESLVSDESLKNKPFTSISKTIMTTNRVGLVKHIEVITNDLKIKSSRSQSPPLGTLRDGGRLRPLSPQEQQSVRDGLKNDYASIELELMIRIAIETGARQQTICTLSIQCIKDAYEESQTNRVMNIVVKAGHQYRSDTKGGRVNRLIFSQNLLESLMTYILSERAESRRRHENSFYSDSDENYVFITRSGNPYYTAQREIADRQSSNGLWRANAAFIVPKAGQALRNELKRFIERIKKNAPYFATFSFHDLRASMGMNIVRNLRAKGYPDSKIFDHVRQRLNHSDIKTTESYLNFDSELSEFNEIQEAFGAWIYGESSNE